MQKLRTENYTIEDGSVDVNGNVIFLVTVISKDTITV
jgi:hypothetical protein